MLVNLVSCCCCWSPSLAARLVRSGLERRRGPAGSRLHVRLVLLFSVSRWCRPSSSPVFAALFFNLGIQAWFSEPGPHRAARPAARSPQAYLRGAPAQHPRRRAGHGQRPEPRRRLLLTDQAARFAQVLATQTAAARADRGGGLRPRPGQVDGASLAPTARFGARRRRRTGPCDRPGTGEVAVLPATRTTGSAPWSARQPGRRCILYDRPRRSTRRCSTTSAARPSARSRNTSSSTATGPGCRSPSR